MPTYLHHLAVAWTPITSKCICAPQLPVQNTTNIPYFIATWAIKICHLKTATIWIATSQDEVKKHYSCNWQSHDASSITLTSPPHLHTENLSPQQYWVTPPLNLIQVQTLIISPNQLHYTKSQKQTDTTILSSAFIQASVFLETSRFVTIPSTALIMCAYRYRFSHIMHWSVSTVLNINKLKKACEGSSSLNFAF